VNVTVQGSISESYPFEVQLMFGEAQCVASRRDWKTDTSRPVCREVFDRDLNPFYHIEAGYRTFELSAEDTPDVPRRQAVNPSARASRNTE